MAESLRVRFAAVEALAREITRGSLHDFVKHDPDTARERLAEQVPALVLWNPAARPRDGVVIADCTVFRRDVLVGPPSNGESRQGPGFGPFSLVDGDSHTIPVQVLDRKPGLERLEAARHYPDQDEVDVVRVAFRSPVVPGLGVVLTRTGGVHPGLAPRVSQVSGASEDVIVRGRSLVNRFVEVSLEPTGALALWDKRSGERFFNVWQLEDSGDAGDTYTYCPPARDRVVKSEGPVKVRRLAAGPLVAALEATWEMRVGNGAQENRKGRLGVRLVVMLHADGRAVRCILDIDNQATNHRLRARVPVNLAGVPAVAGAQFGTVARPAVTLGPAAYPLESPATTAPAHRFVAAADGTRGITLLAPGFFEYEWTPDGDLLVTLLRAVGELSRGDLPTRPGHAGWPTPTPLAQCVGATRVELALCPVAQADLERADVILQAWEDVFLPVRGFWLRDAVALQPPPVDLTLEGSGLVVSAIKPAQAGSTMVLRCYNATDRRTAGAWRFGEGVKSAHRVRADERESVAMVLENRGKVVRFAAEPHEIVTILVT